MAEVNYPTKCQNKRCGKPLVFRRPSERGKKSFCSVACNGASKHGLVVNGVSEINQERIGEIKWLKGSDHPESIASRAGFSSMKHMLRILARAGEHKLAQQMLAEHRHYLKAVEDESDDDE